MKVELRSDVPTVKDTVMAVSAISVCMHVLGTARNDVRAMRAATTLADAGFRVSMIDIEGEGVHVVEEDSDGVHIRHIHVSDSFNATRFRRWSFVRGVWLFLRSLFLLLRTSTDIYHALDLPALAACYVAARLRRKPLIFESYELPFSMLAVSDMSRSRRRLQRLCRLLMHALVRGCAGVIVVSPPILQEMQDRYHPARVALVRNIPAYRRVRKGNLCARVAWFRARGAYRSLPGELAA